MQIILCCIYSEGENMKKMLIATLLILVNSFAFASSNSNPGLYYGQVPTAGQWNSYFSTKLDYTPGLANTVPYWDGAGTFINAAISGDCTSTANIFTCLTLNGYSFASPPLSGYGSTTPEPVFATTLSATGQITSTVSTGSAPFVVASATPSIMNITGTVNGNAATATVLANVAGGLTSNTTINDTVTYTTGGITLASQTAAAGSVWRIQALGTFVGVSSATTRNMEVAAFWGSTQLTAILSPVLISAAQTTDWSVDFYLTASSTTAVWTTGQLGTEANTALASNLWSVVNAIPGSTTVSSGAQTLDLRFAMSTAVATDQWVVQQVTMERIK